MSMIFIKQCIECCYRQWQPIDPFLLMSSSVNQRLAETIVGARQSRITGIDMEHIDMLRRIWKKRYSSGHGLQNQTWFQDIGSTSAVESL